MSYNQNNTTKLSGVADTLSTLSGVIFLTAFVIGAFFFKSKKKNKRK